MMKASGHGPSGKQAIFVLWKAKELVCSLAVVSRGPLRTTFESR